MFFYSLCITCRSVYLQLSFLHSVLYVDQCIYTLLFLSLCYMQIIVYTHYHTPLGITCRPVYHHRSILHCVLHVDHYIYNVLFFTLYYMQFSVSTPFYAPLCVTCRSVYLHRSILHCVLHVDHYIYNVLFFTLCYRQISVYTPFYSSDFRLQRLGCSAKNHTEINRDFRVYVVLQGIILVQMEAPLSMWFYKESY